MNISTNTKVTIDKAGVQLYSSDNFSVKVNSNGVVFDKKTNNVIKPTACGRYFVSFKGEKAILTRLPTLIARVLSDKHISMHNGEKVYVIDKTKPFTPDNIIVSRTKPAGYVAKPKTRKGKKAHDIKVNTNTALVIHVVKPPITMVEVIETKGKELWVSEDFSRFENIDEANAHQAKVVKGKALAEVVLNANGGYVMAEMMYHHEVEYLGKKPYINFVDIMNNNKGLQNVYEESTFAVELQSESAVVAALCNKLHMKPKMTQEEATRIKNMIEVVADAELTITKIVKS